MESESIWKNAAWEVLETIRADGRRQVGRRPSAKQIKAVLADTETLKVVLTRENPDTANMLFDENGYLARTGAGVIATATLLIQGD